MLADANIGPRVIALEISVQTPMTWQNEQKYEKIDKCITKCMLRAEKNVGNYMWVASRSLLSLLPILTALTFGDYLYVKRGVVILVCSR